MFAVLAGVSLTALTVSGPAQALPAQTTYLQQTFTGATAGNGLLLPLGGNTPNAACLTAGSNAAAAPIPGCVGVPDADGSGALRLTDIQPFEVGGVASTVAVPMANGLDATFDSYQYGGSGADGMAFYLAAADPGNPQTPTAIGQFGGSLGYSDQVPNLSGLEDGYLGVGIDAFGNFEDPSFGSPECGPLAPSPNTITTRGPGNIHTGYCVLDQHVVAAGALRSDDAVRSPADVVPVEVVINPSAGAVTALTSGVSVPAHSYAVIVTAIGSGGTKDVLTGALPSTLNGTIPAGLYDPSWVDPTTGYPRTLTFGWTGGTGGGGDNHEVTNAVVTTLLGALPTSDPAAPRLPITGSTFPVALAGTLAAAFLAAGTVLLVAGRRRRQV